MSPLERERAPAEGPSLSPQGPAPWCVFVGVNFLNDVDVKPAGACMSRETQPTGIIGHRSRVTNWWLAGDGQIASKPGQDGHPTQKLGAHTLTDPVQMTQTGCLARPLPSSVALRNQLHFPVPLFFNKIEIVVLVDLSKDRMS